MKLLKKIIEKIFSSMGVYIGKLPPVTTSYAEHMAKVLSHYDVNCVFDVGAHYGEFSQELRSAGYAGWIFSFEPVSENYQKLSEIAALDKQWKIFNFALGDKNEKLEINISNSTVCASFLESTEYGKQQFGKKLELKGVEEVEIKVLDNVYRGVTKDINNPRILLKLDTQGYDLNVLKGAVNSLENVFAIQSELSVKQIYDGMPDYIESIRQINEYGYEVSGVFPVSLDRDLKVIEFDCIFVKG